MKRPTLSLAVIAKNEAHNIRALFHSIQGCFDEVILVDTGSTDDTVSIAQSLGAKVSHFNWVNDFSKARQFAFDQATCDYIMWLDLDDSLRNKEAFIEWRDHVMHLCEFWLAPYHYAFDFEKNVPQCTFLRERVVKRGAGFKWKYFVHEGLIKEDPTAPVPTQVVNTWDVVHRRSAEDLQKDRGRNLGIFQAQSGPMDARMIHYWGKELFENGHYLEALGKLSLAFQNPELQHHDRVLNLQFQAMCFMSLNQYDKAIELAQAAIPLAPNRAEFFVIIGDAMVQKKQLMNAIPFFSAAKGCVRDAGSAAPFIFSSDEAYGVYPRINLVKIYTNLNLLDLAEREADEALKIYDHLELKQMKAQLEAARSARSFNVSNAKPCSDILISCFSNVYEWDGEIYRKQGLGGSETAEVELAENLVKLGEKVIIYNSVTSSRTINGVEYRPISEIKQYVESFKPKFHIAWRHAMKLTDAPTIVHSHDLLTPGVEQTQNYDKVAVLTPFHASFMHATQRVPKSKMFQTRNGIVPERFKDVDVNAKDPFSFVFANSPDRGLTRAIKVLKEVRKTYPKVTLTIGYGWEHLDQFGRKDLRLELESLYEENREWITYIGKTEQTKLMEVYKRSAYWVSPSDFIETSMISAMELACSGIYCIFRGIGGVVDTLRPWVQQGMATQVDSECITEEQFQLYIDATIDAIAHEKYKLVKADPDALSWKKVAEQWLQELNSLKEVVTLKN